MRAAAAILVVALCLGCAGGQQAGPGKTAGFLGDYSILEESSAGGARLRYVLKGVDWQDYDKIFLDPIQFWRGADVQAGLSTTEAQRLANYFHSALYDRLSRDFGMVSMPQPGSLRISIAFIRLGKRNVALDTVSTYVPQARLMSELKGAFTGRPAFVGEAFVEGKISDATTGQLLAAAVDTRVGGKTIKKMDRWTDVKAAIDTWVELLAWRLCMNRDGVDCRKP